MSRSFTKDNVACQHCMWWHASEDDDDQWGECHNVSQNDYSKAMLSNEGESLWTEATHFCGDFQAGTEPSA